jgi:hypothetical protein
VSGRTIKWRAWEFSPGLTVANTKVNTSTIRRKAKASSSGPTEESTRAIGKMESNTVLVSTHLPLAKPREESGTKARESLGLTDSALFSF